MGSTGRRTSLALALARERSHGITNLHITDSDLFDFDCEPLERPTEPRPPLRRWNGMGRRRTLAAAVLVLTIATACGREGPIASSPTNAPAPSLPPIALPSIPERDDTLVVWTQRSDKAAIRVVMTPGEPLVGEAVAFDIKMSYGAPPYRPGGFGYALAVEGAGAESSSPSCGSGPVPVGFRPKPPKPFDDNEHRTYRFYEPGPHSFSLSARPSCNTSAAGVALERSFVVRGSRPVDGLHLTGSDGQRQVDVLMAPHAFGAREVAHLYAIFEDRTREAFSWRISFGDGSRPIAGGPACKRGTASEGGRYERRFEHHWDWAAEYHVRIELSQACLRNATRRGARVIDEVVFVRPYGRMLAGGTRLPSHRFPPVHARPLGPVRLVVDDERCVYLERTSGSKERLQVVWPVGYWLMRKPVAVSSDIGFPRWRAGKVRKDVLVLGSADAGLIPEHCRTTDRALLLGPLTG